MTVEPDVPSDERSLAALAHIGVILPLWGLLLALAIWLTQREKSAFVNDQGRQAIAWQVAQIALSFVGFACYFISLFGFIVIAARGDASGSAPPPAFFVPFIIFGLLGITWLVTTVLGLLGAYRAYQGERHRYPLIGRRVAG